MNLKSRNMCIHRILISSFPITQKVPFRTHRKLYFFAVILDLHKLISSLAFS